MSNETDSKSKNLDPRYVSDVIWSTYEKIDVSSRDLQTNVLLKKKHDVIPTTIRSTKQWCWTTLNVNCFFLELHSVWHVRHTAVVRWSTPWKNKLCGASWRKFSSDVSHSRDVKYSVWFSSIYSWFTSTSSLRKTEKDIKQTNDSRDVSCTRSRILDVSFIGRDLQRFFEWKSFVSFWKRSILHLNKEDDILFLSIIIGSRYVY